MYILSCYYTLITDNSQTIDYTLASPHIGKQIHEANKLASHRDGNEIYASLPSDTAAVKVGSQSSTRVPPAPMAASWIRGEITLITHP